MSYAGHSKPGGKTNSGEPPPFFQKNKAVPLKGPAVLVHGFPLRLFRGKPLSVSGGVPRQLSGLFHFFGLAQVQEQVADILFLKAAE